MMPELWQIDREIGLRGKLSDWVALAWDTVEPGSKYVRSWHVDLICDHLEAVGRGDIKRLCINVPPGCSKSLLCCVFWPTFEWIRDPGLRWIFGSFDGELTKRDAGRSLQLIQSEWFRKRWGDLLDDENPPVKNFGTKAQGWRFATSVEGKATGRHADIHVIDDPTKPKNLTKKGLMEASEWRRGTMASRFRDAGKGRQVLIMQRLHEDDLAGEVIREGWTHLRLPMRYESVAPCVTSFGRDPRTEDGDLLCPGRFDEEAVEILSREMGGMVTAAQLQQRPVPLGGAIFKEENFRYWTTLPTRFDQMVVSVDCTFKGADTSDWVVLQVWGRLGSDYYLLDQVRKRMGFAATCDAIRDLRKDWPKATGVLIEDKANGPAVIETLEKEMSGIVAVNPEGGKEARANAVSPLFEAKNVLIPQSDWVGQDFVPEMLSFPMGRHDDQVDTCTQALLYLHQHNSGAKLREAMRKIRTGGLPIT